MQNEILDVARHAKATALLTGRIYMMGGQTIITSQLLRSSDGVVLKSHKVEGKDLYHLVDQLSEAIRSTLEPHEAQSQPVSIPVAEKTTQSIPAYNSYLAGIKALNSALYKKAIDFFDTALKDDPHFKKALFKKVTAEWWAESHGEIPKGETIKTLKWIESQNLAQSNEEKFMVIGLDDLVQRKFSDARTVFQDLIRLRPDNKDYWYNLGEALFHGGGEDLRALDAMDHALQLDPDFELAYIHILDIYMMRRFYERGLEFTGKILEKNPNHPMAIERRAQFFTVMGEFEDARSILTRAISVNPENLSFKIRLAETNYFSGENESAIKGIHDLLKTQDMATGDIVRCLNILASGYLINGRYLDAANELDHFELKSDSLLNTSIKVEAAFLAGLGGHIQKHDQILAKCSFDTSETKLWEKKIQLESFLAYLNNDTELWNRLETEYHAVSDKKMEELDAIFKSYMTCISAMMKKDYASVIRENEELIKSDFPGQFCRYLLAVAYWKSGLWEEALDMAGQMQSLGIDPGNYYFNYPRSYYLQTMIYLDMGDTTKALQAYGNLETIWNQVDKTSPEWQEVQRQIQNQTTGVL